MNKNSIFHQNWRLKTKSKQDRFFITWFHSKNFQKEKPILITMTQNKKKVHIVSPFKFYQVSQIHFLNTRQICFYIKKLHQIIRKQQFYLQKVKKRIRKVCELEFLIEKQSEIRVIWWFFYLGWDKWTNNVVEWSGRGSCTKTRRGWGTWEKSLKFSGWNQKCCYRGLDSTNGDDLWANVRHVLSSNDRILLQRGEIFLVGEFFESSKLNQTHFRSTIYITMEIPALI